MNLSVLGAALKIAAKELLESFRDRQTLLYTFVLPVCMYPALFWVMVQGVLVVQGQKNARDVTVGIVAPAEILAQASAALGTGVDAGAERDPEEGSTPAEEAIGEPPSGGQVAIVTVDASLAEDQAELKALVDGDGDDAPDAIIVLPSSLDGEGQAQIYYDSTDSRSEIARERSADALRRWADELRVEAAEARDIDPDALDPIVVTSNSVAEKKDEGALVLSLMLPMLLVIMSVLGAFFPAVDLTAGEKERGTAETTMLLPVPRTATHLGKILAVSAAAMIATALNLLALGLSAGHLLDQLSGATGGVIVQLPVGALMSVLPLAVLFAFFVSAMLTGVASLAASFKEGQALLGPVQMVFILPAMAATLPGLTLDLTTAWIPVVNVALAFRAMLVGDIEALPLAICVIALLAAALFAIWFSIRLRSNEQVALAGETLSLGKIFSLLAPTKS